MGQSDADVGKAGLDWDQVGRNKGKPAPELWNPTVMKKMVNGLSALAFHIR